MASSFLPVQLSEIRLVNHFFLENYKFLHPRIDPHKLRVIYKSQIEINLIQILIIHNNIHYYNSSNSIAFIKLIISSSIIS